MKVYYDPAKLNLFYLAQAKVVMRYLIQIVILRMDVQLLLGLPLLITYPPLILIMLSQTKPLIISDRQMFFWVEETDVLFVE